MPDFQPTDTGRAQVFAIIASVALLLSILVSMLTAEILVRILVGTPLAERLPRFFLKNVTLCDPLMPYATGVSGQSDSERHCVWTAQI